jgi:hypothetical protein
MLLLRSIFYILAKRAASSGEDDFVPEEVISIDDWEDAAMPVSSISPSPTRLWREDPETETRAMPMK